MLAELKYIAIKLEHKSELHMIDDHRIQKYCLNLADYPKKADSD